MSLIIIITILLFLGANCFISYLIFLILKSLRVTIGKYYFISIVILFTVCLLCIFESLNNFTYLIRNDLKLIGFPVPIGILKYEQDQWIDFPFHGLLTSLISIWNSLLVWFLIIAFIKLVIGVKWRNNHKCR
jgi:hypothetical protein